MQRSLKWILGIISVLAITVVLAAVALLFWIDPNIFRDDFEQLAAKQGVILKLDGELSWRFFPELQIVTEKTSIAAPDAKNTPIATLDELSVAVALMPLFNKQVEVRGLAVKGLDANLVVNKDGSSNWQQLGKTDADNKKEVADSSDTGETPSELDLGIEKLSLSDSHIRYRDDSSGQKIELKNLQLEGQDIRLGGPAFPLDFSTELSFDDGQQTLNGNIALTGDIAAKADFSEFEVANSQLETALELKTPEGSKKLTAAMASVIKIKLPANGPMSLPVIDLKQGQLNLQGAGQGIEISDLKLTTSLLPGGEPQAIALAANMSADIPQGKATTKIETAINLTGKYRLADDFGSGALEEFTLALKPKEQNISLSGNVQFTSAPLNYQGKLNLAAINPKEIAKLLNIELPEMSHPKALNHSDLSMAFKGSDKQLEISNILMHLDSTEFKGNAKLGLDDKQAIALNLQADVLNIDDYLPPVEDAPADSGKKSPSEPSPATQSTPGDQSTPEEEIDLSALQDLNIALDLKVGQLIAKRIPFSNLKLGLSANGGKLQLAPLSGTMYDSPFSATARIDSSKKPYQYTLQSKVQKLPLGQLLKDLNIEQRFSGKSDLDVDISTQGNTISAIESKLNGSVVMQGQEFQFQGINIERAFCRLVATVQKEEFNPQGWAAFTNFKDTTTRITFVDGIAKIEKLNAGVSRLNLSGEGKVNLRKSAFDLVFNTKLTGNDSEGLSCTVNNTKLLNRNIPIRCKSDFDSVNATSCLPDVRVIEDIAKEKVKDKVDEKAKEVLEEKLGGEKGEAAKQLFKQLFKKD